MTDKGSEEQLRQLRRHREFIDGLRQMADWFETNPDMGIPHIPEFNLFTYNREDFTKQMRLMGSGTKHRTGSYLTFDKHFGLLTLSLNISQSQVCEPVQVGEREVEAHPARPARTEPVYEWKCPPSLMKEPDES